jgi:hypothetical protein
MTWPTSEALTFAHCVLSAGFDPNHAGTIRLARAFIALHDEVVRLRKFQIDENDRLVLFAFAADQGAAAEWPSTCEAIGRVLAKYGPVIG